jgi:hypothetical protein
MADFDIPMDEEVEAEELPTDFSQKNLKNVFAQTPAEQADIARSESVYKSSNLTAIDKELAKASPAQRKILEEERARVVETADIPIGEEVPVGEEIQEPQAPKPPSDNFKVLRAVGTLATGLSGNVNPEEYAQAAKDVWKLWSEESLPAHLVSAYRKGVFDKPVGELVHNAANAVKDFSVEQLWEAAKKEPGRFTGELINAVVADPYLLLAPGGLGGRLATALGATSKTAVTAGHVVEAGIVGGATMAPISAAAQLDKAGFIDPKQLAQDIGMGAAMAAALSGVLTLGGSMLKAKPKALADDVQASLKEGDDLMTALETAMQDNGMSRKQARALTDEFEEAVKKNPNLEKDFAKMRKGIKGLLPEEVTASSQTSAQARQELGRMARELEAQRKSGEISENDFAQMTQALKDSEAARIAQEAAPMKEPSVQPRDEVVLESAAAQKRILGGEAKGYGEEPSALAARGDFLAAKKTLSPSEAKELVDIQAYREVLPELGVEPKVADAMTPSQAKAWIERRLPEAPLETAVKAEAPKLQVGEIPQAMRQRGTLDPEMAKWLFAGVGGAALGGYLADDKAKGAALGAALALGGPIALKAGRRLLGDGMQKVDEGLAKLKSLKRDPAIAKQIDGLLEGHQRVVGSVGLASDRLAESLKRLVPSAERREAVTLAIESGDLGALNPQERSAAALFQQEDLALGREAQRRGIMGELIDNHVAHIWEDPEAARSLFSSVSPESRFAEKRSISDFQTGIRLGLKPKTLDIAEIARMYGKSLGKTMGDKELLETLKKVKVAGLESKPIMPLREAPAGYVRMNHPQLQGMAVHPEMAPSLSYLFHSNDVPTWLQAATAVSAAAKTGALGMSGFHAKSLGEVGAALVLGLGTPKIFTKIPSMLKMLKGGQAGDLVDQMVSNGLNVSHGGADLDPSAWAKLSSKLIDTVEKVPGGRVASLPVKVVDKVARALHHFTFEYLMPGFKLATAAEAYSKALLNPANKGRAPEAIMREITTATNDLFGGLNWRQVSGDIENKFLHKMAASITNPEGLRYARLGLLAPDWTASTLRAGYKGMKATAKGVIPGTKLNAAEDLYRRYFLGGALVTATLMEGLQQHYTGTHFWDNPDPTYVYLPDGRRRQMAKHYTEIFHWLKEPPATVINKLGYVPKEIAAQFGNKEYISAKGSPSMGQRVGPKGELLPPSIPERAVHAAKGMTPIFMQNIAEGRGEEALSGAVGFPTYGRTREERRKLEERAKLRRELRQRFKREGRR